MLLLHMLVALTIVVPDTAQQHTGLSAVAGR